MNPPLDEDRSIQPGSAEETLRLIARLPAPEGLSHRISNRIHDGLHSAPRSATILPWPMTLGTSGAVLRGAAAAAIVCVVAGGGWRIYSHIPIQMSPQVIQMQQRPSALGGFGTAGAKRVPQTLDGPVLTQHNASPSVSAKEGAPASKAEPAKAVMPFPAPAGQSVKTRKKVIHSAVLAPVH
jgi:hypothetical protein